MIRTIVVCVVLSVAVACGNGESQSSATAAPAAPASSAAPKPAMNLALVEPIDGAMGGHIDIFRWSAVAGATGYVVKIAASDGRVVWESAPLTTTETKLPATVALEPEVHTWSVTARKGAEVIAASPTQKFTITP